MPHKLAWDRVQMRFGMLQVPFEGEQPDATWRKAFGTAVTGMRRERPRALPGDVTFYAEGIAVLGAARYRRKDALRALLDDAVTVANSNTEPAQDSATKDASAVTVQRTIARGPSHKAPS